MRGQTIEGQVVSHSPSLMVENGSLFVQASGHRQELFGVDGNQITSEVVFELADKLDSAPEEVKAVLLSSAIEQADSWSGKETGLLHERLSSGNYSEDEVGRVISSALEKTKREAKNKRNLVARKDIQPETSIDGNQEEGIMSRFMGLVGQINRNKVNSLNPDVVHQQALNSIEEQGLRKALDQVETTSDVLTVEYAGKVLERMSGQRLPADDGERHQRIMSFIIFAKEAALEVERYDTKIEQEHAKQVVYQGVAAAAGSFLRKQFAPGEIKQALTEISRMASAKLTTEISSTIDERQLERLGRISASLADLEVKRRSVDTRVREEANRERLKTREEESKLRTKKAEHLGDAAAVFMEKTSTGARNSSKNIIGIAVGEEGLIDQSANLVTGLMKETMDLIMDEDGLVVKTIDGGKRALRHLGEAKIVFSVILGTAGCLVGLSASPDAFPGVSREVVVAGTTALGLFGGYALAQGTENLIEQRQSQSERRLQN